MSLQQLRNVNFGKTKSGAAVGYQILDEVGTIIAPRTTVGVYEPAPGIYSAYINFPDDFRGQIIWDTGGPPGGIVYATEQYNVEENDPKVADTNLKVTAIQNDISSLIDIQYGRWKIENNQMIFYKSDNSTEVARFNLFDDNGIPTVDAVFERVKV